MGAAVFPPCFLPGAKGAADEQVQEGQVELLHIQSRRGSRDEIPLIQGKEQQLCFAGAAVKTYPTFKVRESK